MKDKLLLFILLLFCCTYPQAGEGIPDWLAAQLTDKSVLEKPGVYPLASGKVLGVGQGVLHESLRNSHASRMALNTAERDAKRRIAEYLYPELFASHKSVSVEAKHILRVYEHSPTTVGGKTFVAIVVSESEVSAKPILDSSIILGAKKTVLPSEVLVYLQDPLLQLGGGRIFSYEGGWIAIGVGLAPLFGSDSLAERDAMKRARLEAGKELAGSIFGIGLEALEEEAETQEELDGILRMREWSHKRTRETIEGDFQSAVELGYWFTDDAHVAVVIAVSNQPLERFLITRMNPMEIPDYPEWEIEEIWEYTLLSRPGLLHGGAAFVFEEGALWVMGVGGGKLTGNQANDHINAPRVAEMDARRHIVKLLIGYSSMSESQVAEELIGIMHEHGAESSMFSETLQKTTRENITGKVSSMACVGSWKSMDRNLLYQVYVVNVSGQDE